MTMIASQSMKCGNCRKSSEHSVLLSTNSFGSSDLDLRPPEMQRSTMHTWLKLCPHCSYCAPDITRPPAHPAVLKSPDYHEALHRDDVPDLARLFLAYALTLNPSEPATVANAFLNAAWVCDDHRHMTSQAQECRLRAAEWFRRCKPFDDDEQSLSTGAVLVDVLRRAGQFADAASECQSLLKSPAATDILRQVLEYQQRLISQKDRDVHVIADCVPPTDDDDDP